MSSSNPTPLRIGMTGTLDGWRMRIAARLVMSMEEDGETYYWNEFILVDGFGRSATLVHEDGENGPEWKLFKQLEPLRPMTVAEAQAKRPGDRVEINGMNGRVSLVDESRVHHIDGRPPEGVEPGDVAHYFNVDVAGRMLVVSWTGDEIEYYSGEPISWKRVAEAFGVSPAAFEATRPGAALSGWSMSRAQKVLPIVIGILIVAGLAIRGCDIDRPQAARAPDPAAKQPPPAVRLANGARGTLGLETLVVASHAVVDVGRVGARYARIEYHVRDAAGGSALLVNGLNGRRLEWHLLKPIATPRELTPYEAAARRKGQSMTVSGFSFRVAALCLSRTGAIEGEAAPIAWPAGIQYGFVAENGGESLLARWTEAGVRLFQGRAYAEAQVLGAFAKPPAAR